MGWWPNRRAGLFPQATWSTVERRLAGGSEVRWLLCSGITVSALEAAAPTSCCAECSSHEVVAPGWCRPCVQLP